jgi:hypothetical protein
VAVERSVCAVLLGDVDGAIGLLGVGQAAGSAAPERTPGTAGADAEAAAQPAAAQPAPDPEVLAFITAHSRGSADPLPGVCALAQKWLDTFRAAAPSQAVVAGLPGPAGTAWAGAAAWAGMGAPPTDLNAWFDRAPVRLYLRVRGPGGAGGAGRGGGAGSAGQGWGKQSPLVPPNPSHTPPVRGEPAPLRFLV